MEFGLASSTAGTGVNTVVRTGLDLGAQNTTAKSWADQLQTASYRGIPFGVLTSDAHFGRRNALHEYPFRDGIWVEDLGRAARKINITGFLVEGGAYGPNQNAGQVIPQRERLIRECEAASDGELVHPSLGRLNVSLLGPVGITERWDHGRVFELTFSFVEAGQRIFPTAQSSTPDNVAAKAANADGAASSDFAKSAGAALRQGAAVVGQAISTATSWYRTAQRLSNDATNIANLAKSLPAAINTTFGRYTLGSLLGANQYATSSTVTGAMAANRQALATTSANLAAVAGNLGAGTAGGYGASAQAVAAALLASAATPADALRMLSGLANFTPAQLSDTSQIGQAMNTMQTASANLFRRAAVVAMARASAAYQPSSQDDAVNVRTQVLALLDAEVTTAADSGDDASYAALRDLRAAVVQDIAARGAGLPALVTVTTGLPLPVLALAQRLYRDASRADDLVTRAHPVHPAFMPVSFRALSA